MTEPPIPADTIPLVLPEMLTLEQFIEAYADKEPEHEAVAE